MSQLKTVGRQEFPLGLDWIPHPDWMRATHYGGQSLLSLTIQMLILSKNTLTDTPRIMFDQISGHPWPGQINTNLTITK